MSEQNPRRNHSGPNKESTFSFNQNHFSTDLIFRIGTRTATITAVYERVLPRQLPSLPVPPPVVITPPPTSSTITNIYEEPKTPRTIFTFKRK